MADGDKGPAAGKAIKIVPPEAFPVEWDSPEEAGLLWSWDNFHNPAPTSPMQTSTGLITRKGMQAASRAFGREPKSQRRKDINGYPYAVVEPDSTGDGDEYKQKLTEAIATTERRWVEEFVPELEADLARMKAVDFDSLSDDQLVENVDAFLETASRHWEIHFLVVFPVHASMDRLKETYEKLVGEETGEEAYALVDSTDTFTMRVNRALEQLGRSARGTDAVSAAILGGRDGGETIERLQELPEGREWLAEFNSFMDAYGYRPSGYDMRFKTWREDPDFVFVNLRGHLNGRGEQAVSGGADPVARANAEERVRTALVEQEDLRAEFEERLAQARQVWHLKEDHGFYIDHASHSLVRMAVAALGRRLAGKGVIDDGEDVFYLEYDEARNAMAAPTPLQTVVGERASNIEAWTKLSPVRYLGTIPASNPPADALAQVNFASHAASGGDAETLEGQAASVGKVTGPARVVITPAQFGKVQQGDVLVCRSTAPTWTPLFSIISALVSEAGGVLSHPAIIAREHNLPAVVGVLGATDVISDGQLIEVDGDSGRVRISGLSESDQT